MEIGENNLTGTYFWPFFWKRFLHLDDYLSLFKNLVASNQFCSVPQIIVVCQATAQAGTGFHQDGVATTYEFFHTDR